MCGRFTAAGWGAMRGIAEATGLLLADAPAAASHPSRDDVLPRGVASVVALGEGGRAEIRQMTWGFDLPGAPGKVVFNARAETAAASPLWGESLARRRCIVPVEAFYETHRSEKGMRDGRRVRQVYRFSDAAGAPLLMAGVWQDDRFSVLTCAPDAAVSPVHDRMPLLLAPGQAEAWLRAGAAPAPSPVRLAGEPVYAPACAYRQDSLF